jgi:hypothetical protein
MIAMAFKATVAWLMEWRFRRDLMEPTRMIELLQLANKAVDDEDVEIETNGNSAIHC